MKFSEAIKTCLIDKYADFSGRASRSEYWYFILFFTICYIPLAIIDSKIFDILYDLIGMPRTWYGLFLYSPLTLFFAISMTVPSFAATVRRLHDTNLSGWFVLVLMIPIFGAIAGVILMCRRSVDGQNNYDVINKPNAPFTNTILNRGPAYQSNSVQSPQITNLEYLEKLHQLKEKGILSEEEFRMQRNQLLGLKEPDPMPTKNSDTKVDLIEAAEPSASEAPPVKDSIHAIRRLHALKENGAITVSEFESAKTRILGI